MAARHLLKTGSGLLNPKRNASACLFETAAGDILLDCGEPVAATLARQAYDWKRPEAKVLKPGPRRPGPRLLPE
jgi:ribonuclease BN (tRNA processing enzyme)